MVAPAGTPEPVVRRLAVAVNGALDASEVTSQLAVQGMEPFKGDPKQFSEHMRRDRIAASSGSAFAAMHKAVRQSYECMARDELDPFMGKGGVGRQLKLAHATCGLEALLAVEKNTTGG